MAFIEQEDILNTEDMVRHLFKVVFDVEIDDFPRMDYEDAMRFMVLISQTLDLEWNS